MSFEVYHSRQRKEKSVVPIISLSKSSIVLNKTARNLLNAQFVELAFNRDEQIIRIRATEESNGNLLLQKTKLVAKKFYSHFGIKQTGKFKGTFSSEEKAIYVELNVSA